MRSAAHLGIELAVDDGPLRILALQVGHQLLGRRPVAKLGVREGQKPVCVRRARHAKGVATAPGLLGITERGFGEREAGAVDRDGFEPALLAHLFGSGVSLLARDTPPPRKDRQGGRQHNPFLMVGRRPSTLPLDQRPVVGHQADLVQGGVHVGPLGLPRDRLLEHRPCFRPAAEAHVAGGEDGNGVSAAWVKRERGAPFLDHLFDSAVITSVGDREVGTGDVGDALRRPGADHGPAHRCAAGPACVGEHLRA